MEDKGSKPWALIALCVFRTSMSPNFLTYKTKTHIPLLEGFYDSYCDWPCKVLVHSKHSINDCSLLSLSWYILSACPGSATHPLLVMYLPMTKSTTVFPKGSPGKPTGLCWRETKRREYLPALFKYDVITVFLSILY